MNRRRVVEVAVIGPTTLECLDEDGERSSITLTGPGDTVSLIQSNPQGLCQRCGHDHVEHGDWDWDDGGEFWQATPCQSGTCPCHEWMDFTPLYVAERSKT